MNPAKTKLILHPFRPGLRVTVTEKGQVTDVQQLTSSGIKHAATLLTSLLNWKYTPRRSAGQSKPISWSNFIW